MSISQPFSLKKWIDDNRHLLKPPVGNQQVYKGNDDYIVMVVGGPNSRKDYHFQDGEELFYQLEGDITLKTMQDGKNVDVRIKEGDMFLLPPQTPHSPQRGAGTVGLVIEKVREEAEDEKDAFMWFCENCGNKLYEDVLFVKDIVKQLPPVMEKFWGSIDLRTCKKCGTIMEPPVKK